MPEQGKMMEVAGDVDKAIFISYCHADNENLLGEGWIGQFHKVLRSRLKAITGARKPEDEFGIWRDNELQGNEEFASRLLKQIVQARIVISILTPSYIHSEWCLREIEAFMKAVEQDGGLVVDDKTRIFKVLKTPVERDKHPQSLQGQTGYEFYLVDNNTMIPTEFSLLPGDPHTPLALQRINDIAYSIMNTIQVLAQVEPGKDQVDEPVAAEVPTIYLAETSHDFLEERNMIRRELEAWGFKVLPEDNLPLRDPDEFDLAVNKSLEQCSLSVHMIGAFRAAGDAGSKDDITQLQNQLAASWSKSHKLERLIWIPPDLAPEDADQQEFLKLLQTDSDTQAFAEVLKVPRQELVTVIHDAVKKQAQPTAATEVVHERKQIYVSYAHEDADKTGPLTDYLYESGYEVLEPLSSSSADNEQIFEIHKRNLSDCDAVILFAHSAGEYWLKIQLSELSRAAAWREGKPPLSGAVYLSPQALSDSRSPRTHFTVIEGEDSFNPELLADFLAALRGDASD